MGLGLSLCYSIIKKHNGYIFAESTVGAGTTFHIYLPALQIPLTPPLTKGDFNFPPFKKGETKNFPPLIKGGEGGFKGRILVMDDEEVVRDVAGKMLKHIGYEAGFAGDGTEAIEIYKKAMESGHPFDAVIMDLTIPGGMGGKEAIKKLKEIDPGVKAIVSSGYADDEVMAEFREYGFMGAAAKPYKIKDMRDTLQKVIRTKN
ncbi:MAG: response regulator [Nitrospinae bacterium]|nr:response regulator [Nitrospinota bacterium]